MKMLTGGLGLTATEAQAEHLRSLIAEGRVASQRAPRSTVQLVQAVLNQQQQHSQLLETIAGQLQVF